MSHPPSAVFLDRDGTLIVEKHYLSDPDQVVLEEGVVDGLRLLSGAGHALVVVSNQSGIGRGLFAMEDAHAVNERVAALLRAQGIEIAGWYMCPHAPLHDCVCRKPLPGLALQARDELGTPLEGAYVIGDKRSDVELAALIGGQGLLVTTGHGAQDRAWAEAQGHPIFGSLRDAAQHILADAVLAATRSPGPA